MNNATFDLPKTKLCAAVVLAWGYADQSMVENATAELQAGLGNGWSTTSGLARRPKPRWIQQNSMNR